MQRPSFYAHILHSIIIIIAIIIFCNNYSILVTNPYNTLIIVLLFCIIIGIHSLSHLGLEYIYKWPSINNSKPQIIHHYQSHHMF